MVNFGPVAAEISPVVWGTLANFNRFRILAALLRGTTVVVISQTVAFMGVDPQKKVEGTLPSLVSSPLPSEA